MWHKLRAFLWLVGAIATATALTPALGSLYESDFYSGQILRFNSQGQKTTFVSGINGPSGLAFDQAGNLFVAEANSGQILKITPAGVPSVFASELTTPTGLAFDSLGNLYEADAGSSTIFKFTSTGSRSIFASGSNVGVNGPAGLAFNAQGNLFESNTGNDTIAYDYYCHKTWLRAVEKRGRSTATPRRRGRKMGARLKGVLLKYFSSKGSERRLPRMPCSAFLFFGRVIGTPQLTPPLAKADLGNTP